MGLSLRKSIIFNECSSYLFLSLFLSLSLYIYIYMCVCVCVCVFVCVFVHLALPPLEPDIREGEHFCGV